MTASKTRIAILGSGPASLATAWEITESPDWDDRFEIDIYVMGWRLGGKCASGRNLETGKVYEHGLHILGGFYHNTFMQLRKIYDQWAEDDDHLPLKFEDVFVPKRDFSLMQEDPWDWREVGIRFEDNGKKPGVDPPGVGNLQLLARFLRWLGIEVFDARSAKTSFFGFPNTRINLGYDGETYRELSSNVLKIADNFENLTNHESIQADVEQLTIELEAVNAKLLRMQWHSKNADLLGLIHLGITVVKGVLEDRVWDLGYDAINDQEAIEWLKSHGAGDRAIRSAHFQALYHYAFGYQQGDPEKPNIAAGAALRSLLRMMFHVHGSVFYHMAGGMGEIFVLPYYDVLLKRGVRFHFYHKVVELLPDHDRKVSKVIFEVQAQTKGTPYQPIVEYPHPDVSSHRRTWPDKPLFEQLKYGEEIERSGIDFEDALVEENDWSSAKEIREGVDFDVCVLAIPPSAARLCSKRLMETSKRWKRMIDSESSCPTLALQLWSEVPPAKISGFTGNGLLTGAKLPLDTWADMSDLIAQEVDTGEDHTAKSLSYYVGAFPEEDLGPGKPSDVARKVARRWLAIHAPRFMPGFCKGGKFDDSHVVEFQARLNGDPAKYYSITPAGSTKYRMRSDDSGFSNLFLAGDWTKNGADMGAVESAVMSGKQCARAICGYPLFVYGETDFD